MIFHCIIHQQALCGKALDVCDIMQVVVKTVNYIRSHALKHREFKSFLAEIESQYPDLPYHCEVRWLSRGKVLQRFFELRHAIDIFMIEKNKHVKELSDDQWLWKLAFVVDLTSHLNFLNLKLQGEKSYVHDLFHQVKAFRAKLALFETQLDKSMLDHYTTCKKFSSETIVHFPSQYAVQAIAKLREEFQTRFTDFDHAPTAEKIQLFQNPFSSEIETLLLNFNYS